MTESSRNRASVETAFQNYEIDLQTTRTGPLGEQIGAAAEAAVGSFLSGETQAGNIAEKNSVKKKAFSDAATALEGLRSGLRDTAATGNKALDDILASKEAPIVKAGKMGAALFNAQGDAARQTAQYVAKIGKRMQWPSNRARATSMRRTPHQAAGRSISNPALRVQDDSMPEHSPATTRR
ncbi:hypothetical protein [Mycolicibacterium komossense]|uniref:ESX-1 secretion-associated protein EspA/EspE-like domain-containing protein n=1 Tax=Mycolicibacterium komossense TaxID=1779 RepID=A0ABT3CFZ3_9MYCO|nr:hypothetical protein [Mycolicibacterium komossense]MCV7228288.1 hypothetical protein [Mycolicibacterium komossense]